MQTAAKKDSNHNEIKAIFESSGISCHDVHQLKKFCDMIVSYCDITELVEVKNGNAKLTRGEEEFAASWPQEVHVIRCVKDALEFIDMIRAKAGRLQKQDCKSCQRYENTCPIDYSHNDFCGQYLLISN